MAGRSERGAEPIDCHGTRSIFGRGRHHCFLDGLVGLGCGVEDLVVGLVGVEVALHLPLVRVGSFGAIVAAAVAGAEGARVGDVCGLR